MRRSERFLASRIATVACACAIAAAFVACGGDDKRSALPDWSDGYEQGGPIAVPTGGDGGVADAGVDAGGMPDDNPPPPNTFAIRMAKKVRWPMRIRDLKALDKDRTVPCYVKPGPIETELDFAPTKKIECLVDMDEYDLYINGLQFDVVVPKGMCDFLLRVPYWFVDYEIGFGPTQVSWTVSKDGKFSNEIASKDGVPLCAYDHSGDESDAPNCCLGSYTLTVTDAQGETTTTSKRWGGGSCDCVCGANYFDKNNSVSEGGCPVAEAIYVGRQAFVQHEDYGNISEKFGSNAALANYYEPSADGGVPGGLADPAAHPMYEYYCLDDAEENIAHIGVVVREWNEEVEFDKDGDPDTIGTEPGWKLPTDAIDDIPDWTGTDYPELVCPH